LRKNPLLKFSTYTDTEAKVVQWLGQEIIEHLDTMGNSNPRSFVLLQCEGLSLDAAYAKFVLWVFGAFEIVRTMRTARRCFSERVKAQIDDLKRQLAPLRSVFAKQQLPEGSPVTAEGSIYTTIECPYDYVFRVGDQKVTIRGLIGIFRSVIAGITVDDVLADQRTMYT
jgi:hypothetical protein